MSFKLLAAAIAVSLTIAGGIVYNFGTPQAPDPVSPTGSLPAASAVPAAATPQDVVAPDPTVPLAIEIPGCVCHSDDPAQVEAHKAYRMNQCGSCHAGGTPTGQE